MDTMGPIWKSIRTIMVLGMVLSAVGVQAHPAEIGFPTDCPTQIVRITLASEQVTFCSPTDLPFNLVEDSLTDPQVNYAGLDQLEGYGIVNIRATAPGSAAGPGKPVYQAGQVEAYRQSIRESEELKSDRRVSTGATAALWDEPVASLRIDLPLSTSLGVMKLRTLEWDVEHQGRLWTVIFTWDTSLKNAAAWEAASKQFNLQAPTGKIQTDTAEDLGKAFRASQAGIEAAPAGGGPVDVTLPAWWEGEMCDYSDYLEGTGVPPVALGLPWRGVYPCGTIPTSAMVDFGVTFYPGGWGQFEWECVELVNRFLYMEWGIPPIHGNAKQLKDNLPANGTVEFYPNDGTHPLVPGDIITEDASTYNSAGHAMLVLGTHIDSATGHEYVDIMEQNTGVPGARRSIRISAGVVNNDPWVFGQQVQGWLHVKANQPSGDVDPAFTLTGAGLNGPVTVLGLQPPDNKIIAGGDFTAYDTTEPRNHIVQLETNGSLDTTFVPGDGVSGTGTPQVFALTVQTDHKILLGGYFGAYDLTPQANLARLLSGGTLDDTFNNGSTGATFTDASPASVNAFAVQPSDGKILVGGFFDRYNGESHANIARLSGTDGAVESTFTAATEGPVYSIALLPGGKILLGGGFPQGIARLNADGTPDPLFNPSPAVGANGAVRSIALQENKIYIAGNFSGYNSVSRNGIARLNSDGSLDTTFNPGMGIGGTLPYLTAVVPQPDGRVLIGGSFSSFNGAGLLNFGRLNNDGSLDSTFLSRKANDGMVNAILLQPDGKILIGGAFTGYLARLLNQVEPCYSLTTLVNPSAPLPGGTISINPPPNCPGGKYISGTPVVLTATRDAAHDFWFDHWSGDVSGSLNQISLAMDGSKTITANFTPSPGLFHKLSPANGAGNQPAIVTLRWETSPDATSYTYCIDETDNNDCDSGVWTYVDGQTSDVVINLAPNIPYYWQVMAWNTFDSTTSLGGWWSLGRDGIAMVPAPFAPNGVIQDRQPAYEWKASNGADAYHLVIESVDPAAVLFHEDVADATYCSNGSCSFRPALTLPLGNYRFKVSSHTAAGYSDSSTWISFRVVIRTFLPLIRK